jgi:hypothetical protein
MGRAIQSLLAAAAEHVVPSDRARKPLSYATWNATRQDDEFDLESTCRYLTAKGINVDEALLRRYARIHESHVAIDLCGLTAIAPWIECLDEPFVEYSSFRKLRETPRYVEILTFTTPAISEEGDSGFLEVWTEDGRYAQMGSWWWIQLQLKYGRWTLDWMNIHAMS